MICFSMNYYVLKKNSIYVSFQIWVHVYSYIFIKVSTSEGDQYSLWKGRDLSTL